MVKMNLNVTALNDG